MTFRCHYTRFSDSTIFTGLFQTDGGTSDDQAIINNMGDALDLMFNSFTKLKKEKYTHCICLAGLRWIRHRIYSQIKFLIMPYARVARS